MPSDSLTVAVTPPSPSTGASTTPDGRWFLVLARIDESAGPQVVEVVAGEFRAYPDESWNSWAPAAQLHRMSTFRGGQDQVRPPVQVFTLPLDGVGPPGNDHA